MSAPVLTPLDSPVFDEDVIAAMEDHADDEPECQCYDDRGRCEALASHVAVCNFCDRQSGLMCAEHTADVPRVTRVMMHIVCRGTAPLCELIRVVPL